MTDALLRNKVHILKIKSSSVHVFSCIKLEVMGKVVVVVA